MKPNKRVCVLVFLSLLCAICVSGQTSQATVAVPFTLDIGQGLVQEIQGLIGSLPDGFTFQLAFDTSSALPPGLAFSPFGVLSGTPTAAGTFAVSVNFDYSITFPAEDGIPPISLTIPFGTYTIVVSGGTGPPVTLQTGALSFSLTSGAAPSQQPVTISNNGATPVSFQASATGGSWLTVTSGGTIGPVGHATVAVTVNPASLQPGTYTGAVAIAGSFPGSPLSVPVVVTVTGSKPLLTLSQNGLFFRASAGGPAPPSQGFTVSNGGVGTLSWAAAASTFGGGSWLSVSPTAGSATASSSTAVSVQVNTAGLAAGTYYGQVQVSASGVPNSPQSVSVVLNVAASAINVDPDVRPTGLIFVGRAGATGSLTAQKVNITNLGSTAVTYNATVSYGSGTGWLSVSPASGSIASGTPSSPAVTATIGKLSPGVYTGQVSFFFTEPNTSHNIAILLIVLPAATSVAEPAISSDANARREVSGCTPTKLIPVFTLLGQSFSTAVAWPVSLEVTVVDDCGTPVTAGSVIASFSSGDEPLSLTTLNDGRWSGTWTPHSTAASVSITATAQTTAPPLSGAAMIGGSAKANTGVPIVASGGVVNAASNALQTPVAPGSYITIYGSSLAPQQVSADAAPFPTQLGGTQVLLAGQAIPLRYASDGQVNALLPFGLSTNASLQLVVARNGAFSTPQMVTFADGGPAIFPNAIVGPSPATAGDVLVLYCNGLGAVDQALDADSPAPSSPLAYTKNPVTVTIAGTPATVLFAGLAPGFAGLYQVNIMVPPGLTPSSAALLVLTVAGQSSPPAPIVIK